MKISKRDKIILILGSFFILFTVLVAFLLRPKQDNLFVEGKRSVADYEILDKGSQKLIKSKEAGFSLFVPAEWIVKDYDDRISFSNLEIEIEQGKDISEIIKQNNICSGKVKINEYSKADHEDITSLSNLIEQVEAGQKGKDRDYAYSLININNKVFLKTEFTKDDQVVYISTKTIANNTIYHIDSGLFFSEECEQAFNSILQTVKIDK
ncbi:hypothetical protein AMJ47_00600 [Parcubacteria bacterium DG_72]|nr:MAG: hypothetical protein AMJ47_00600 [Parcubacteria bacterium DG_72]